MWTADSIQPTFLSVQSNQSLLCLHVYLQKAQKGLWSDCGCAYWSEHSIDAYVKNLFSHIGAQIAALEKHKTLAGKMDPLSVWKVLVRLYDSEDIFFTEKRV